MAGRDSWGLLGTVLPGNLHLRHMGPHRMDSPGCIIHPCNLCRYHKDGHCTWGCFGKSNQGNPNPRMGDCICLPRSRHFLGIHCHRCMGDSCNRGSACIFHRGNPHLRHKVESRISGHPRRVMHRSGPSCCKGPVCSFPARGKGLVHSRGFHCRPVVCMSSRRRAIGHIARFGCIGSSGNPCLPRRGNPHNGGQGRIRDHRSHFRRFHPGKTAIDWGCILIPAQWFREGRELFLVVQSMAGEEFGEVGILRR